MSKRSNPPDTLTSREWQVLELIAAGLTNEQIADRLGISANTAKFRVSEIISKLGVSSRHEAVELMRGREPGRRLPALLSLPLSHTLVTIGIFAGIALISLTILALVTRSEPGAAPAADDLAGYEAVGLDLPPTPTRAPAIDSNPFAYCAGVGIDNEPSTRFSWSVDAWASLRPGVAQVFDFQVNLLPSFTWRCADGQVLACMPGNNLHCGKADMNREPAPQMIEYCANPPPPESLPAGLSPAILDYIPRPLIPNRNASAYSWRCRDGRPEALPGMTLDARGFFELLWRVVPSVSESP